MSVMCSFAVCRSRQGLCRHEKAMASIVILAAIGVSAYLLAG